VQSKLREKSYEAEKVLLQLKGVYSTMRMDIRAVINRGNRIQ